MLTIATLIKFLAFDSESIKAIASNRRATWLGLLFVISAGFAREYDGEYLLAEPWHLLIPVAASLIASFSMTLLVFVLGWFRQVRGVSFFSVFHSFLNLYWMTAPLAWLYAIPVERFLDPGAATSVNLTLLGIVAAWRVLLMVRCVQVLYNTHPVAALFPVILFSDTLAMLAIWLVPGPVFMIMGGVRLTDSENLILSVRVWLILIGYGTYLIWLIGYLALCARRDPWRYFTADPTFQPPPGGVSLATWGLAMISLLVWIPVLPFTQSEQRLRWHAEQAINSRDFESLSELTRQHAESEFPPHWDPPPRPGYGERKPNAYVVLAALISKDAAPWMIDRYSEKTDTSASWHTENLRRFSDEELTQFVDAIAVLPESESIADKYRDQVSFYLSNEDLSELGPKRVETLNRLLELAPPETQDEVGKDGILDVP